MYADELKEAFNRNIIFGISAPDNFCSVNGTLLNSEALEKIKNEVFNKFGYLTPPVVVGKCFNIHYKMLNPISRLFGLKALLTFGYLEVGGQTIYKKSDKQLEEMFKHGAINTIGLHAWLTLPTYEIIDITFMTTFAVVKQQEHGIGGMIYGFADDLAKKMKYHPLFVGENVLEHLNIEVNN
ncbi:MAG: hypothetical protein OEZ39_05530 [Gammaproteobacteria bacterium]|nr:hypothetical protein [Gammaproteobacteria bacterium]MDH5651316.1 hypothetical protein [Gammaproteobacteria bacterium]